MTDFAEAYITPESGLISLYHQRDTHLLEQINDKNKMSLTFNDCNGIFNYMVILCIYMHVCQPKLAAVAWPASRNLGEGGK